jgi:hypothetical protein
MSAKHEPPSPRRRALANAGGAPAVHKNVAKKVAESDAAVAAYLKSLKHPLKKEIEAVRLIVLGVNPAITEGIKWNVPSFRTEKEWFATFNIREKDSAQLIFHLGAKTRTDLQAFKIADPNGLMKWLGKDRAMVTLGAGRDIAANRKALESIVRAWIKQL